MLCHDSTYRAVSGYITPSYATHPRAHNVRPYGLNRDKTQFSAPDYILILTVHTPNGLAGIIYPTLLSSRRFFRCNTATHTAYTTIAPALTATLCRRPAVW